MDFKLSYAAVLLATVLAVTQAYIIRPTSSPSELVCQEETPLSSPSVGFYYYTGSEANKHAVCLRCCSEHPERNLIITQTSDESTSSACLCNKLRECQKPVGNDCMWYVNCLDNHKLDDCSVEDDHAIHFLWRDCGFLEKVSKSTEASRWFNSSRTCVQQALAPLVASELTCSELKERAYSAYTRCNIDNGLCDLDEAEFNRIADFVGRSLVPINGEFVWEYNGDITKSTTCAEY